MPVVAAARKKISVNLQPAVEETLEDLVALTGLKQSEVIQESIKLLGFFAKETQSGRKVYSMDNDGENPRELILTLLPSR